MEKYILNYHTGVTVEVELSDLSEAKKVAEEGIAYTQEDDNVLETVGDGFYQAWSDEMGE
ncbi:hypothetical protein P4K49_28190 [Bacillus cereus]|uniref:hypothetical protein n=1 Tax=Bacillus thuringiensis TaxID=1428 RepID=UPI000676C2AA|nr:hypothetical protein [Bacillus thuringiensis]MEB8874816.1 hypothetical protein [Bacillus cereus]AKR38884.1 Hypothetical protein NF53_p5130 [Bacillus thuringiensis serovar indiana]MBG9643169.1 hypothetical protein [Bacillus thuringiensis]MBG9649262.1 hypothetical protein [Bacillus thuringiensis]MEB9620111.1 hypothetical protein [Bacillus cereus]